MNSVVTYESYFMLCCFAGGGCLCLWRAHVDDVHQATTVGWNELCSGVPTLAVPSLGQASALWKVSLFVWWMASVHSKVSLLQPYATLSAMVQPPA